MRAYERTATIDEQAPQRPIEPVGEHFPIIVPFTQIFLVPARYIQYLHILYCHGNFLFLLAQYV